MQGLTRLIGVVAALALLAAPAVAQEQPVKGGTLSIVQINEPPSLLSAVNTSTYIGTVSTKIMEGLLDEGN